MLGLETILPSWFLPSRNHSRQSGEMRHEQPSGQRDCQLVHVSASLARDLHVRAAQEGFQPCESVDPDAAVRLGPQQLVPPAGAEQLGDPILYARWPLRPPGE